jgi:dolichol-phosphate mannosyltransferase
VVLPAYNEEAALPVLLEAIDGAMSAAELPYRIVLVDDGSADHTPEIAERYVARLPLIVERHPVNLGLGATLRDGLTRASELAAATDVLVTLDADNSQPAGLIPRMVRAVDAGRDVVIASRYRPGSRVFGVSLVRRALSYWGSWLFRLVLPIPGVRDYTCGFRAYRAEVLQRALVERGQGFFDQQGFQSMVDVLLKLRGRGLTFGEVPLVLRYDLKEGASKMRVLKTIRSTLALIVRRRVRGR